MLPVKVIYWTLKEEMESLISSNLFYSILFSDPGQNPATRNNDNHTPVNNLVNNPTANSLMVNSLIANSLMVNSLMFNRLMVNSLMFNRLMVNSLMFHSLATPPYPLRSQRYTPHQVEVVLKGAKKSVPQFACSIGVVQRVLHLNLHHLPHLNR